VLSLIAVIAKPLVDPPVLAQAAAFYCVEPHDVSAGGQSASTPRACVPTP
jgi:hypothetical protein